MFKEKKITFFLSVAFIFSSLCLKAQFYSGSNQSFGKNRLQFRKFLWRYFKFDNYKVYYYTGGKELATYASRSIQKHQKEVETLLDNSISGKMEYIIYNKHSHFKQSNIGANREEEYNIGGKTKLVGTKVFAYYEGDLKKFEEQIRSGIARVAIRQLMYGGGLKNVIRNSTFPELPTWYEEGLVSYIGKGWNKHIESKVKDGVLSGKFEKINRLKREEAELAGHAIWNYIAEVYGENVISNILYMTRTSKNFNNGFLYVLGLDMNNLFDKAISYYKKKYRSNKSNYDEPKGETLPINTRNRRDYYQFKISPNGKYAAFVSNVLGKYKVWLYNIKEDETDKIYRRQHKLDRLIDRSFPVLEWHPTGKFLTFITEEKGKLLKNKYNVKEESIKQQEIFELEKVLSMDYNPNGRKMVFSAVRHGKTNIYLYNVVGNTQQKLTKDFYSDKHPRFINKNDIVFSSNRPHDTLIKQENILAANNYEYDLYKYTLNKRSNPLQALTNTKNANETQPSPYDTTKKITFLSDKKGFYNRYLATFDSTIINVDTTVHYKRVTKTSPLTNYPFDILEYEINPNNGVYSYLMKKDGEYAFYKGNRKNDILLSNKSTFSGTHEESNKSKEKTVKILKESIKFYDKIKEEDHKIDIRDYQFGTINAESKKKKESDTTQKENEQAAEPDSVTSNTKPSDNNSKGESTDSIKSIVYDTSLPNTETGEKDSTKEKKPFKLPSERNYILNFTTNAVTSRLDNTFMNTSYQQFSGLNPVYNNPGLSGFITMGANDLFENYKITGGFRLSGNLNNNEYFLQLKDYSKRMDKKYLLHRRAIQQSTGGSVTKQFIHEGMVEWIWPFNEVSSIRGLTGWRFNHKVIKATDIQNLGEKGTSAHRSHLRLSYVFDNTLNLGLNLKRGLRLKFFGEYFQNVKDFDNGDVFVTGGDVRYYQRIHRNLIVAGRVAGSHSFGSKKLVNYMGGVDNWLFPDFNRDIKLDENQVYAFQTIATPMRGFNQNIRNGNNFAIANYELRFPIFDYFSPKPIQSDFIKNFQTVGFFDIGTAWTGKNPYSEENAFNEQEITQDPVTVIVKNQREPVVYGYGFGLRSRIWGYFIRTDWAWGVNDGEITGPQFYFSLSLDF
ncbi:MAG: hypothetical protein ABEH43_02640 [Flavobacteriales bacterium]